MTKMIIPQKPSNSGSIYDLASDNYDRTIDFGKSYQYAVILPAFYGGYSTRHRTLEATAKELEKMDAYNGVRVFNRDGHECDFDNFEMTGEFKILSDSFHAFTFRE